MSRSVESKRFVVWVVASLGTPRRVSRYRQETMSRASSTFPGLRHVENFADDMPRYVAMALNSEVPES
jgi:hypothetical protein